MKKISTIMFASFAMLLLQACKGGGFYYGGHGDYDHGHCHGGYYNHCNGGWHHNDPHYPGHRPPRYFVSTSDVAANESTSVDNSAALLADDFAISQNSAEKIIHMASGNASESELANMGLSTQDVVELVNMKMPADTSIASAAAKLGEDQAKIQSIMAGFIANIQAEKMVENISN